MGSNCITHQQNMEKSTRTKQACRFPWRSCWWEAASGHALYHSSVELNDLYSRNATAIRWKLPPNNMHKNGALFFSTPALFAATSDTTEKYHTWQNIITQWLNMEGGVACLNSSVGAMSIWTLHRPAVHVLNLSTAGQKHVSYQVAAHY